MHPILSNKEFELFRNLIYKTSGINLAQSKKELVKSRLSKRLAARSIYSFAEYYRYVTRNDKSGEELIHLLDSISTNKTDFFREKKHFDFLHTKLLPELIAKKEKMRNRKLRIWCAASSSGEEPYTLAMTVLDHINPESRWDIKILATDISTKILQKAIRGVYTKEAIDNIPQELLSAHFSPVTLNNTVLYKVNDHLKELIVYRRFNLMTPKFPFKNPFDFIFCRNVMIYFDPETQQRLVSKFYDCLPKDGYLFIGHSETLAKRVSGFKYIQPALYQK